MTNGPEELTLVTDFGKLKAGDLVVAKRCGICGRDHRAMLIELWSNRPANFRGTFFGISDGWRLEPGAPCMNGVPTFVTRECVHWRHIYLVDTGLEQATEDHAERQTKLEGVAP